MKLKFLFLCFLINTINGMESNTVDGRRAKRLEKSKQILREIGDYYDFEPTDNSPLDEATVMNPFWQTVKALPTKEEKINCISEHNTKTAHLDTTWANDRLEYAARVYAHAHFNDTPNLPFPFIEALLHKDIPLLQLLIKDETIKKNIEHGSVRDTYIVFSGPTATTIEGSRFLLNAGFAMPRNILHLAMQASHEPALVDFYRKHGACPLKTDKEELPRAEWPTRDWLGMPIAYSPAALPIVELALNSHNHKQFSDVLSKFDGLTNNLTDKQLISMFEHNKEYGNDVMSVFKYNDHPHAKALMRVIENRYAELKK